MEGMEKLTAVEWFVEEISKEEITFTGLRAYVKFPELIQQAKEMEKEQSQRYAEFAIHCDRREMKILEFNDYIKL